MNNARPSNTKMRLKQIMSERGLKQVDIIRLAEPLQDKYGVKISKPDLSQYVNGKVEPGQEKLYLLAAALNVSEAWLMGYDVPQSKNNVAESTPDTKAAAPAADKIPAWATSADVAEWIDFIKEDQANNLNYKGIELTEDEKQQLIGAMSSVFWKHMKREKDRGGNE